MAKAERRDDPIQALLKEGRRFRPSAAFAKAAQVKSAGVYKEAARNSVAFWEKQARTLRWMRPWRKGLEWKLPYAKWFIGGKLNVSDNCLDRHVEGARRNKAAFISAHGHSLVTTAAASWYQTSRPGSMFTGAPVWRTTVT